MPLIESAIGRADAFLAVMSPDFMRSKWCSRERDMALVREQLLQENDPDRVFVHVLNAGQIRPSDAGFLGPYNWVDFHDPAGRGLSRNSRAEAKGCTFNPAARTSRSVERRNN